VLVAAWFGVVAIETVGVGQDEVAVTGLADVTVLVVTPGMGDDVQSLKAGVMEAADVFVVNKADLPGADAVEAEIRAMQSLTGDSRAVVRTVGLSGSGVEELVDVVMTRSAYTDKKDKDGLRRIGQGGVRLDHLGVAVRSIAAARGFYEGLGLRVEHEETVAFEQVRTAMLPMGESRIELLEATAEDSTIGRFVAKRGEGLHHLAIRVEGIEGRFAEMKASGVRLASDSVRVGAGGHRYFFVHPASTGGVLVELVGD
jgi:LAO/AO transport system kinase